MARLGAWAPSRIFIVGALCCLAVAAMSFGALSCTEENKDPAPREESKAEGAPDKSQSGPRKLYLPEEPRDDSVVDLAAPDSHLAGEITFGPSPGIGPLTGGGRCPTDMVDVAGAFCIDRFEVTLVDAKSGRDLSPHFPPSRPQTKGLYDLWSKRASSSRRALGREIPVPAPPSFQLMEDFAPRAVSVRGRIPAGYLSRTYSEIACRNAGKRLCSRDEWERACRGEGNTKYPYGDEYQEGICNVHRKSHPASLLHGNASENHLDPRLGLTYDEDGPLLLSTGDNTVCVSRWGGDAVFDMVGNLDEWIEDPGGSFVGGFYSRATREGCHASIDSHDPGYIDYSLGTRCCKGQL